MLRQFVNNINRPLFYSVDSEQFAHGQGVRHYGFLKEVVRGGNPTALQLVFRPEAEAYFREVLQQHPEIISLPLFGTGGIHATDDTIGKT